MAALLAVSLAISPSIVAAQGGAEFRDAGELRQAILGTIHATPAIGPATNRHVNLFVQQQSPYSRVLTGTAVGGVVGAAAGLGIAAIIRQPGDAEMFPADLLVGTVVGAAAGMYLGARIGSGRQGNPWLTGAAVVGGAGLGILAGILVGDQLAGAGAGLAPEVVGVALGVGIPIGLTSYAEWRTSR
jgi:hypothetical protein